jgi:hypothetical protein
MYVPFVVINAAPGDSMSIYGPGGVLWSQPISAFTLNELYFAVIGPQQGTGAQAPIMLTYFVYDSGSGQSSSVWFPAAVAFIPEATPPAATPAVSPTPNANGWNNTIPVTVNWNWNDSGGPGINSSACTTSSTTSTQGAQTLMATCTDVGGLQGSASQMVMVDSIPPTITYSGDAGNYTVDQTVSITCSAMDNAGGSGLATNTCANISGPAYTFKIGTNTFSAMATDKAGNAATTSVSFIVKDTSHGGIDLVNEFETKPVVAAVMDITLAGAQVAFNLGAKKLGDSLLTTFIDEVTAAKNDKSLTAAQAAALINVATGLQE